MTEKSKDALRQRLAEAQPVTTDIEELVRQLQEEAACPR